MPESVYGYMPPMPKQCRGSEFAEERAGLGVKRSDVWMLHLPPTGQLLDYEFAVSANLEIDEARLNSAVRSQFAERRDQRPILGLIVGDNLSFRTEVESLDDWR